MYLIARIFLGLLTLMGVIVLCALAAAAAVVALLFVYVIVPCAMLIGLVSLGLWELATKRRRTK